MDTPIKVLLDGKYFGYATDLKQMADLSGLPIDRFSFDEKDLQAHYSDFRRNEYPSIGDQLDAIWKGLLPQEGSEAEIMKRQILGVKDKYPKP
jgi:hypothetical protein